MHGLPRRKAILIFGILSGLWNIFIGVSDIQNFEALIIGLICIFLSIGFFMLWWWIVIPIFIFCVLFFFLYVSLIIAAVMRAYQGFAGIALFFHFPTLILCLLLMDNLCRKQIRNKFIGK